MGTEPITENSISEADFRELWQALTHNQQRFAVAMLHAPTKKEAADAIGLQQDTVYRWNGAIDTVIAYMRAQAKNAAIEILANYVAKAAMVKAEGLDCADEIRRQEAATEILDRIVGKPTQRSEISGPDGSAIPVKGYVQVSPDDWPDGTD